MITVMLPVYKNDNPVYFEIALESVLKQTYRDFKVLIGVDGPVEGSLSRILKRFENSDRIEILYFTENRGLACVLNDLIARSRELGVEFLARMDADDVCVPDRFERQMAYLQNNPHVDVVGGRIEEIDGLGKKNGKFVQYPQTNDECRRHFRYRDPLAHPATFFRMRFFDKVKGYRSEYRKNQDTMLWFDGFMNGCIFANLQETVLYYRITTEFYRRRKGWKRAKKMLSDRMDINSKLEYDKSANIFAIMMFFINISPSFIKRFLYKLR